jgi:hypothetical protein
MSNVTADEATRRSKVAEQIRELETQGFVVVSRDALANSYAANRERLLNIDGAAATALRLASQLADRQMKAEANAARDIAMLLLCFIRDVCVSHIVSARADRAPTTQGPSDEDMFAEFGGRTGANPGRPN